MKAFFQDESGQASAEYTLVLSIAVAMVVLFLKKILTPAYQALQRYVTTSIQANLFGANLHYFQVRQR